VRAFLGRDFYEAMKLDLVDITGKVAWNPSTTYAVDDIVDYFGFLLKSLVGSNTLNPCEDAEGTSWQVLEKFQSECNQGIWENGMREYLACSIMASTLDHTTFPAGARGVTEWLDDAANSRSASQGILSARKQKLISDATEWLEALKDYVYREHIDEESNCDFSEMLFIKGCTTTRGIHRPRRFHFLNSKRTQNRNLW